MVENADLICNLVYDYYETRILLGACRYGENLPAIPRIGWSRQVTMFGFSYYLLLPLARGTSGNEYSSSAPLLPTPLASDTGDVGKGLDIQISANGSYRKMNKDGKAWTARLSHG